MPTDCFACESNARVGALPPREEITVIGSWRVAHAFGTSLPGWLVVVPTVHATSLQELSRAAAATLGEVLQRVSHAQSETLGCEKSYFVFFAEAEGFAHLHVHVIPRMPWFAEDQQGPRVFSFLGVPEHEEVSESDRDALALRIRAAMS
jgi:diadenosine tetraphosphate (Ap4A) HIT family hydrolase